MFALIGGTCLLAALPNHEFDARLAASEATDPVTRAYVLASLRNRTNDTALRFAAVRIALRESAETEAGSMLADLAASPDQATRLEAEWMRLELAERVAYALEPDTPPQRTALVELRLEMERLAPIDWRPERVRSFARKAKDAGAWRVAHDLYVRLAARSNAPEPLLAEAAAAALAGGDVPRAFELYRQLAERGGPDADRWLEEAARVALANGRSEEALEIYLTIAERKPDEAARIYPQAAALALGAGRHADAAGLYLRGLERTTGRDERRTLLFAALRALQAASLFDRALAVADQHGREFLAEVETVEFLARLAMAANRPQAAQRYARLMLQLSRAPVPHRLERALAAAARLIPSLIGTAHAAEAPALNITLPFDEARYRLAFDIFAGNRNLKDARRVAEAAVARIPADMDWRKRLAQVSEWDGEPRAALVQWLTHAKATGSDESWDAVLRLAPALFDYPTFIAALEARLKKRPSEPLVLELARVYGEGGRARDALALLRERTANNESPALLEALAELSRQLGEDRLALQTYDRIAARSGLTPALALKQAVLLFTTGRPEEAWRRMERVKDRAAASDRQFWSAYSQFAQFLARHADAVSGYRRLVDAAKFDSDDLERLVALLRPTDPREAARLAEYGYVKLRNRIWVQAALELYSSLGDWTAYGRVLAKTWAKDLAVLERDPSFLATRARYHEFSGDDARGRADLLAAIELDPRDVSLRQTVLWQLVSTKSFGELRELLANWQAQTENEPSLWQVYAAAYVAIGEPQRAVRYFDRAVKLQYKDPLLLLAYASALEQTKRIDKAWAVRRHVWTTLRRPEAVAKLREDSEGGRELHRSFVELALKFAPPDTSAVLLGELLRREPQGSLSPAAKELALSWAIETGANEAARAWFLQQYAGELARGAPRPYWAELSVALSADDRTTVVKLLDEQAELLPMYDRIEASRRVGRHKEAEQLAFDLLDRRHADDELHLRLTEAALPNHDWLAASLKHVSQGPLRLFESRLSGAQALTNRVKVGAAAIRRDAKTNDSIRLPQVPGRDNAIEIFAQQMMQADDVIATVTYRDAAAGHAGARAEWRTRFERGETRVRAGAGQESIESAPLRTAGMKHYAEATAAYRISKREYVSGTVRVENFYTQAGTRLGRGAVASFEFGHRLRTEYPDLSVRVAGTRAVYHADGQLDDTIAPVLPLGSAPSVAQAVPQSYSQLGTYIGFGEVFREEYTRALRPFADAGLTWTLPSGSGYGLRLGAAGSVLGSDHLVLYIAQSKGARGTKEVFREAGVGYRW